jgi:hypothetical protein
MPQVTIRLPVVTGTDVYLRSLAGRLVSGPSCGRLATSDAEAPADKDDHDVHRLRHHIPQIFVAVRQNICSAHKYDIAYSGVDWRHRLSEVAR